VLIWPASASASWAKDSFDPVTGALSVSIASTDQDDQIALDGAVGYGVEACVMCNLHEGVKSVSITTAKTLDVNMRSMDALVAVTGGIPVTITATGGAHLKIVDVEGSDANMPCGGQTWRFVTTPTGFVVTLGSASVPVTLGTPSIEQMFVKAQRDCAYLDLRQWRIPLTSAAGTQFEVQGGQTGTAYADPRIENRIVAGGTIYGGPLADYLGGLKRNDRIYGYGGSDELIGGPGNDVLYGGDGNDEILDIMDVVGI
jgi:Ca2+-binding RTX toxin-like protein